MKSFKAYLYGNGRVYYSEHFGFFTKTKNFTKIILLPNKDIIKDCLLNFGLEEKDIIDLRDR